MIELVEITQGLDKLDHPGTGPWRGRQAVAMSSESTIR